MVVEEKEMGKKQGNREWTMAKAVIHITAVNTKKAVKGLKWCGAYDFLVCKGWKHGKVLALGEGKRKNKVHKATQVKTQTKEEIDAYIRARLVEQASINVDRPC
jgi:hypothetical protein